MKLFSAGAAAAVIVQTCLIGVTTEAFGIGAVGPDLVVDQVSVSPDPCEVGQSCTISALICNIGDADTDIGLLGSIGLDYFVDGSQVASDTLVTDLAAGECQSGSVEYAPTLAGIHEACVTVDSNDDVAEGNEANNQLCGTFDATLSGGDPVPTVSQWGMIVMTMVVLVAGTVVLSQRKLGCFTTG